MSRAYNTTLLDLKSPPLLKGDLGGFYKAQGHSTPLKSPLTPL